MKLHKPKEVPLESSLKDEAPNIEVPNNENKLFDVDDDVGTSTIPILSVPSEEEEEEVSSNNVWEHTTDISFKLSPLHPDGKSLRKWVKHQNMDDMERSFTNRMRSTYQLVNFLHLIKRILGIKPIQNSLRPIPSRTYTCFGNTYIT